MRPNYLVGLIFWVAAGQVGFAAPTKDDCRVLQQSLTDIAVDMGVLHERVKFGTEATWLGSFTGEQRDALKNVQTARVAMAKAVEAYLAATQDAAVGLTACALGK